MESWLVDVDGDGRLEVVGEPWAGIAKEQLRRQLPMGTAPDQDVLGRMRYVWKWDSALQYFALVSEHLLYLGPRGLPPEGWEQVYPGLVNLRDEVLSSRSPLSPKLSDLGKYRVMES
jgi:hypothetical protein